MKMKERVKYCDLLRVIAIVSVIFIHVFADFRDSFLISNRNYYSLLTFLDSFTRTGVPLFFMLTGIFMLGSKKEEKYSEFLKKKASKLFIPFFVISIIYYIYEVLKSGGGFSILQFLNAFTSNQVKYHFWFMYSIILIYLLIPFMKRMIQNLSKEELRNLILVILLSNFLSAIFIISRKFDYSFFSAFLFSNEIRYLNYLFLGYYLYHYGISKKYHRVLYLLGVLCIFAMPILDAFVTETVREDSFLVAGSILPFIASTALFTFVRENYDKWGISKRVEKFFTVTSPLIFYIYMMHVLVMEITKKFLFQVFEPFGFKMSLVFMGVEFIITFVGSYILAYILNYLYSKVEKLLFQKNLA